MGCTSLLRDGETVSGLQRIVEGYRGIWTTKYPGFGWWWAFGGELGEVHTCD